MLVPQYKYINTFDVISDMQYSKFWYPQLKIEYSFTFLIDMPNFLFI